MSYQEANVALGPDLREDGVGLTNDQFDYVRAHTVPFRVKWHLLTGGLTWRFHSLLKDLRWASFLGSPFVWILAGVGLFSRPWNRIRLADEGLLCGMVALTLLILGSMHFIWTRFLLALLPIALIWAAKGAVSLHEWIHQILKRKEPEANNYRQILAWALPIGLILLVILVAARGILDFGEVTEARRAEAKSAGGWIASQSNETKTSWSVGMVVPYYAGTVARLLPYSDSTTALAYLRKKAPDFIVLRGDEIQQRPYLSSWLQEGIPDPCARLVYRTGDRPDGAILVYEWSCK